LQVEDAISALNDSGLVKVRPEKFVKLVEKHKVDTHVADLASVDPAPHPEATTGSVPPPVVVNPEPPSTAGSKKGKKGKKNVKVDSMFDFWGGGGKLRLHESAFMSIMFDALQGMQVSERSTDPSHGAGPLLVTNLACRIGSTKST